MICDSELDNCNTISELIALRHVVTAVCSPCNRYRILDLESLREKYGETAKIRRIALKLKCDRCGRRDGQVIVQPMKYAH